MTKKRVSTLFLLMIIVFTSSLMWSQNSHAKTIEYQDGSVYEGRVQDGVPHGLGRYTSPNGEIQEGYFAAGELFHKAKYIEESQSQSTGYSGERVNSKRHGQGTYIWKNGIKYTGEWINGEMEGQGTLTWTNGNEYIGEMDNGYQHGQGTFTWTNGDKYIGGWINDERSGQGTFTWANGDKYVGEWKNDNSTGQGAFTWASGNKYIGDWVNDVRTGQGTFIFAEGGSCLGLYQDNDLSGYGFWKESGVFNNEFCYERDNSYSRHDLPTTCANIATGNSPWNSSLEEVKGFCTDWRTMVQESQQREMQEDILDEAKSDAADYITDNSVYTYHSEIRHIKSWIKARRSGRFTVIENEEAYGKYNTEKTDFYCDDIKYMTDNASGSDSDIWITLKNREKLLIGINGSAKRIRNAMIELCELNGVELSIGDPYD